MAKTTFKNMEQIITTLKKELAKTDEIRKYDGITIQIKARDNVDKVIKQVEKFCADNKIINFIIEKNGEDPNIFILQLPEFIPEYTDKMIEKMYKENFKWLISNSLNSAMGTTITKNDVLNGTDRFVKHAITIFHKSNTNQYKVQLDTLLNDANKRYELNNLFRNYVEDYWSNNEKLK